MMNNAYLRKTGPSGMAHQTTTPAMEQMNGSDSPTSSLEPSRRNRSRWACVSCRARKSRCDVSIKGAPCTRCCMSGESCQAPPPDRRGLECHAQPNARPRSAGELVWRIPRKHCHQAQKPGLTGDSKRPAATHGPSRSPEPLVSVDYACYRFLTLSNVAKMPLGDLGYAQSQGCFLVPGRPALDTMLQQYFLRLHPFFPLLDEASFWGMYHGEEPDDAPPPNLSLLVLQAMLFAACNFVPTDTLDLVGFSTIKEAKACYYKRASVLFSLDAESSSVAIAQASLLLSHTLSPSMAGIKELNTTWLNRAIHHAEIAEANRYDSLGDWPVSSGIERPMLQRTLKRLWWCCVICDALHSLCFRRRIHIDQKRFAFTAHPPLCFEDLENEVQHSKVYCPRGKTQLFRVFERFVELCVILANILPLMYPMDERRPGGLRTSGANILTVKRSLRLWESSTTTSLRILLSACEESPSTRKTNGWDERDKAVAFYLSLMKLYYHTTWLALCHFEALAFASQGGLADDYPPALLHPTTQNQQEIQVAALSAVSCLESLKGLGLDRWLPGNAVACTAIPLFLSSLDVNLSSLVASAGRATSNARLLRKNVRLKVLLEVMTTYFRQYDGADLVVDAGRHIMDGVPLVGLGAVINPELNDLSLWKDILEQNPKLYLRLVLAVDLSLSKERLPVELDFPTSIQNLSHGGLSRAETVPEGNIEMAEMDMDPSPTSMFDDAFLDLVCNKLG
ncbi:fungal-specific transcription factor domain-containing protein [Ilyonectria destructans]|nr:fungal-specific transcription factor domain-containing protein [Ilyonectria destructans]